MKIIVSPDSFKGSCSAIEVADSIEQAIHSVDSTIEVVKMPVADGGEGRADISFREQRMVRDFILHYRDRLMEMWEEQSYELLPSIC